MRNNSVLPTIRSMAREIRWNFVGRPDQSPSRGGVECGRQDKASVARFLTRNPGLSRVATDAAAIIGVSLCGHDGRRGHIYHLAVDPRHHGVGLGKRLVQECFAGLRDAGIQRAIILVANDNARGRAFWKRCDWEELSGALAMGKDVVAASPPMTNE